MKMMMITTTPGGGAADDLSTTRHPAQTGGSPMQPVRASTDPVYLRSSWRRAV
jgi:hypothetical protein